MLSILYATTDNRCRSDESVFILSQPEGPDLMSRKLHAVRAPGYPGPHTTSDLGTATKNALEKAPFRIFDVCKLQTTLERCRKKPVKTACRYLHWFKSLTTCKYVVERVVEVTLISVL